MGSQSKEQTLIEDLKLTTKSICLLYPSEPQQRRSMFLSNIDQVLNLDVQTIHFFAANPAFSPETVAGRLKTALERLLVPYDFLAGRLRVEEGGGRLEIDCNAAGVGFVVAVSELSLAELGDLEYPNPAFRRLAAELPEEGGGGGGGALEKQDRPLSVFQLTSFSCGGFAMGVCNNHTTVDGISFRTFLLNLASLAASPLLPLPFPPHTDRRLLAARSPPSISFPHPELIEVQSPSSILDSTSSDDLHIHLFHMTSSNIASLKRKASNSIQHHLSVTSFAVVVAHLWRCKALAASHDVDEEVESSTILFAVDLRRRLVPPLPPSYTGNAVLSAAGRAPRRLLESGPFGSVVEVVSEAGRRMDDEYARSVIDWGEMHAGFPRGDVFVSSWWKLGFEEVEFPWGRPVYSCPVVAPSKDIVLLFPPAGGVEKGVNAVVAMPAGDLERFTQRFYDFLD